MAASLDPKVEAPLGPKGQRLAFVLRWLFEHSVGGCGISVSATTLYDQDEAFVYDFAKAFPGRTHDPNCERARARVSRVLAQGAADGYLNRGRLSNPDRYHPRNEPTWLYAYSLYEDDLEAFRKGKLTPERRARQSWGDA
ncbi:hypothetical protein ACQKQD_18280 [Methylobacterium sp. NPDC080182]|uniref:hypothetical protein n=1 Tax=Methylobacterium sp. NPDC080182 TaxID=3390590 RepID=UPI003D04F633